MTKYANLFMGHNTKKGKTVKEVPKNIKHEIEKLVKDLNYHCYRYYVLDSPVISDEEYDRLYKHLKELEEQYGYVLPDSPTQRVGAPPLDKFVKVKHKEPMLSLDNAFSEDEVKEFEERIKRLIKSEDKIAYTVEPKYDGLAIELTYINSFLRTASTRGDGYEGEDVTQNIRTIKSVPLRIEGVDSIPEEIDIRGEVYMDVKEFEKLNKERGKHGESIFANPRNAAAGS
ncbi:MAG: NAD-dependent DNA ligase LigA, partial [Thermodesulfovibrionia bacterium]|nr:NAD-dependent DNA ligase LigA [Thermodesulfovibrionia bacterium]